MQKRATSYNADVYLIANPAALACTFYEWRIGTELAPFRLIRKPIQPDPVQ